jgi:hypothetical protein
MKIYHIKQYIDDLRKHNQNICLDKLDASIDLSQDNALLFIILSTWASLNTDFKYDHLNFNYEKDRLSYIINIYERYAKSRFMQVFFMGENYKNAFHLYQQVNPKIWDIKYHDNLMCVTFKERNETDKYDLVRSALSCDGIDVLILKRLKIESYIHGNYFVDRDMLSSKAVYYEILNQIPNISVEELIFLDKYKKFNQDARVFLIKHCETKLVSTFIKSCSEIIPDDIVIKDMENIMRSLHIEQYLDFEYHVVKAIQGGQNEQ